MTALNFGSSETTRKPAGVAPMPGETPYQMGEWLGELKGITLREAGDDADAPVVELHGSEKMAAGEAPEQFVEAFTEAAAQLQLEHDRDGHEPGDRS